MDPARLLPLCGALTLSGLLSLTPPVVWAATQAADAASGPVPVDARPRVGLVLGGGGARGAAHIGVLEVMDRLRVPVDCVAGTSMGALVAGAWAAGLSPAQMRQALAQADWSDMFQDSPGYAELSLRSKRLSQRFLPGSEVGMTSDGTVTPPGMVSGQKIKLFFNHLVGADTREREIQHLPLPVSIMATDIGTGERVVLRDGPLALAMRASMSVPGLMVPLHYRDRQLVDGGLVDNLPIREVRERCGAEVVIAVNVGSPLLPPESVTGLLGVTAQVIALLTEQNVQASLAALRPQDIYLQPVLDTVTAGDFQLHAEAADRGRQAAQAAEAALQRLSVDETRYRDWRARMAMRAVTPPRIDAIEVEGGMQTRQAIVRRHLEQPLGQPLDTAALNRDLLRAYGDGWYERVDYSLARRGEDTLLRLHAVEKPWGPDYLRLGLQLESSHRQGSTFRLRAGYHKTWLNDLGGELLVAGEFGSTTGASIGLYQPLTDTQRWFVKAEGEYLRLRTDLFYLDQRIAEYRSARSQLVLATGWNLERTGQLRLGWRETKTTHELTTGLDLISLFPERSTGGWLLSLDLDQLDRLHFPRRGWALQASLYDSPRSAYSKLTLNAVKVWPVGDWVLGTRASWVDSPKGELPLNDVARLGGFMNLSGYAPGQVGGDRVAYLHLRAERILGQLPLGLRGDFRAGLALEMGRVGKPYAPISRPGWTPSIAVYIGGETPLGPVYVGYGRAAGGSSNAYLAIGSP